MKAPEQEFVEALRGFERALADVAGMEEQLRSLVGSSGLRPILEDRLTKRKTIADEKRRTFRMHFYRMESAR